MAESEQVIRLSGKEDIHAVRTLLGRAQAKRLLLVVPPNHPAFKRLVRVKMLVRQAHTEGIQVAIVSSDPTIRDLAGQVDLSAFRSVESGQRARRWRKGQGSVNGGRPHGQTNLAWHRGRHAVLARRQQIGQRANWGEVIMLMGLIFGMMIILSAVLLLLVPSAQITLVPRQLPLEQTLTVTVDSTAQSIDYSTLTVPGELLTLPIQTTQQIPTTGRRDVPSAHARGAILFINVTGEPVNVPSGTIVYTSSGSPIRFRTLESAGVPGQIGARVEVPVEALTPGPAGNVGPLQINQVEGAAATAVRVLNPTALEGGDVQQTAVVTAADKEQLQNQLRQRLLQEGRVALEQRLAEMAASQEGERFLVPGSVILEITAETFNGSVDDQREVLQLDLRARVSGVVVAQTDLDKVAQRTLEGEVPEGYRMLDDGFRVVPGEAQLNEQGRPVMAVRSEAIAVAELSGEQIRTLVRGQPLDEAEALLLQRLPLAANPSIDISPGWWSRLPYLPFRIFIRLGVLGGPSIEQELP